MSFAEHKALLQAKLKIAEAELAAERLTSERLRRANNATASPIGQREQGCSEMDGRLDFMSMLQGVLVDMPSQEALVLDWFAGAEAKLDSYDVPLKWRAGVIIPCLSVRARGCLAGLSGEQRKNYAVLKAAVLKGLRLASVEREPGVAAFRDGEHSESVGEQPVALQNAAERESREDSVGVAHTASCVSGGPQMSSPENVTARGSSREVREESANQGTAAHVMQPQVVAGRTAVAEYMTSPALHNSVTVPTKQPSAAYDDQRFVVENGVPSAEAAEPEGSPRKRRQRQSASPQCSVAATHAHEPAAVPPRARKRGGEGPLIMLWDGVRRMARAFSDDDGRCVPPAKGRSL
ncbi:hypothetical protein HPB48_024786 [Haemaphysalis longicornis]|uniref:Uncharacterized protein n=1 Tax=Haemaphysalis longicornis TaxID=44386 RepID=A0A9J6H707_HAELO|nr:hypothetical protein HPB48_024786 [Haemaphysalis longicornis]